MNHLRKHPLYNKAISLITKLLFIICFISAFFMLLTFDFDELNNTAIVSFVVIFAILPLIIIYISFDSQWMLEEEQIAKIKNIYKNIKANTPSEQYNIIVSFSIETKYIEVFQSNVTQRAIIIYNDNEMMLFIISGDNISNAITIPFTDLSRSTLTGNKKSYTLKLNNNLELEPIEIKYRNIQRFCSLFSSNEKNTHKRLYQLFNKYAVKKHYFYHDIISNR
ncbi:hypothetical protein [Vibrio hippocampi]|uniref:Uncharacterized protein n=1 Tax=Vibrio hippocampi TaxID=654686 RepID=A0ABM8ZLI0_9VIBR|nr:hypothetical protein [Vibrio hippocampi]CAH0529090.1 hypothetical protein VHP8226_03046 [Vibrio hippocampi]